MPDRPDYHHLDTDSLMRLLAANNVVGQVSNCPFYGGGKWSADKVVWQYEAYVVFPVRQYGSGTVTRMQAAGRGVSPADALTRAINHALNMAEGMAELDYSCLTGK